MRQPTWGKGLQPPAASKQGTTNMNIKDTKKARKTAQKFVRPVASALLLTSLLTLGLPGASATQCDFDQAMQCVEDLLPVALNCDITGTVCAGAGAWASGGYSCYNPATQTYYACWSGGGSGSAYSNLGLVSGVLTGSTNSVPLSDTCYSDLNHVCFMSDGNYEYPGNFVSTYVEITATAPQGFAYDSANAYFSF
jgi:hypothetical protein